jgi:outer membrane lipoprotein-sorting protein
MIIKTTSDQRGIAHVIEIVIIAVIVLGVGGFIAWRVMDAQQKQTSTTNNNQPLANVPCNLSDKDLCKFFTSWKASGQYKVTSTQTTDGQTTTSTYEASDNAKKYHMTTTVNGAAYEIIGIDSVLYTKAADGTWWKQQTPKAQDDTVKSNYNYDFKEPTTDSPQPAAKEPTYTKLGKEACGSSTCFKYQVNDPSSPNDKQFIWFDDKDYQMRHFRTESADGSISDQIFAYSSVNITAPSPTKDLGPNQYVVPGQSEPMTVPSADDLKNLYNTGQ